VSENITNLPKGLISVLGLRDYGSTPPVLAAEVRLGLEGRDLYLLNSRTIVGFGTIAVPVVNSNVFVAAAGEIDTVPPGELWYVWNAFAFANPIAATAIRLALSANLDGLNTTVPVGPYESAAALEAVRARTDFPFWASSGTRFGALVQSITGAPGAVTGFGVVTRLRI